MKLLVTVLAAVVAVSATKQATVEVKLKQGAILGSQEEATNGRVYYSFRSIPYARPPVGPLRFREPEPAPIWSGVRNGSLPIPKCPQANFLVPGETDGQEDCLYLNVYTPTLNSSNFPVMVYIHGGGFAFGSAEDFGSVPAPLMQKDVVVVAINYRLGCLGFLTTGDSVLPGNLGLKDQTLALRWVQDNIRDLGGDPQQVTIFGVSAGGMSVHFHILSPSSRGLFRRGILQSGTALLPSVSSCRREHAIKISKALNCTGEATQQLFDCFREATVEALTMAPFALSEWFNLQSLGPCVDGTFLPDEPATLMKEHRFNKVDVMTGATKDDGNVVTTGLFAKIGEQPLQELINNFTKVGPVMLWTKEEENPVYLARRMMLRHMDYKTDFNITRNDEIALTNIIGNRLFQDPNMKTAEFHGRYTATKTYMYQFDYQSEQSIMSIYMNTTQQRKMAGHGDEMKYFAKLSEPLQPFKTLSDLQLQEIFVTLWTNFAATGDPTINGSLGFRWDHVLAEPPLRYLSITPNPIMMTVDSEERDFWDSLPTKINKILYPERFARDD